MIQTHLGAGLQLCHLTLLNQPKRARNTKWFPGLCSSQHSMKLHGEAFCLSHCPFLHTRVTSWPYWYQWQKLIPWVWFTLLYFLLYLIQSTNFLILFIHLNCILFWESVCSFVHLNPRSGCANASVYSGSPVNPASSCEHGELCVAEGNSGPFSLPQPHLYLQICDLALKESVMTHCLYWTYCQYHS